MRIYLDNCCFNRPYDDQTQMRVSLEAQAKLYVQELIKAGKLELASSWFITYENANNPHDIRKKAIQTFLTDNVSVFVSSEKREQVETIANSIMISGIKKMDACHIASAILAQCDCILTTDKRMLKYESDKIEVLNPTEFVTRLEDSDENGE